VDGYRFSTSSLCHLLLHPIALYPTRSNLDSLYAEALISALIATPSGVTPVSTKRHSAISSFLAIATIAIRECGAATCLPG
jgi:hypothetical protein